MTVVVTGGAGFIGSHVVDMLLGDGERVVVIDDLSSGSAARVDPRADLEVVDISDEEALAPVIEAASPSAIFHLAAQASVVVSVTSPRRDNEVNVRGTLNLLEAARRAGAPLTFTSTGGALYGNDAPIPTPEKQLPSPVSPYGASKWAAEAYVTTWANSSRLPHSVCRLGNVYGPRQSPHGEAGVVAIHSHALWSGERPHMFGFGKPTRDYIHVADVAEALRLANGAGDTFNISTGVETPVAALFALLQEAAGTSIEPDLRPLREGELERSCIDPSHAAEVLGWRAKLPLRDGLIETYNALAAEFEADEQAA
jgi:UDP-glucose 4-epimerase